MTLIISMKKAVKKLKKKLRTRVESILESWKGQLSLEGGAGNQFGPRCGPPEQAGMQKLTCLLLLFN